MKRYIMRRLLAMIPILIGISILSFMLINLGKTDPAEVALRVNEITPTKEAVASMRMQLGLDKPYWERYVIWMTDSLQGDFGHSYATNRPVAGEIARALPATIYLALVALLLTVSISVSVGILCAIYQDRFFDRFMRGLVFIGTAMPNFWAGLLLMWLFAVKWDLVPTSGMEQWNSVLLPAFTLSLGYMATYIRLIRNNMVQNMQENYVLYCRIRGLKERTIIRHVFKNSLHSSLTALGMSIPKLIAGTVIVENIFAWPGIGRLCVTAIFNRDFPIIQAYILLMACLFVLCNLLVDIGTVSLDPRMKGEG